MEGKMHLSGQLSDWSINDLLQIMQVTKKTGSLDIEGVRRGRIHFRDGTVTGAELSGSNGRYVGRDRGGIADVLYVLSTLDDGTFAVGAADGPDSDGWSVEDVMDDVESLKTLEGEVVDAGLFEAESVRLTEQIDDPITIDPEDWGAVAALVRPFTLSSLESLRGRGGAVRLLHTLHRLGVAQIADDDADDDGEPEEDESGWLDRLAGDIVPESDEPTWVEEARHETVGPVETVAPIEPVETVETVETTAVADDEADPVGPDLAAIEAPVDVRGVSAPASTILTDGVYDEIRRLRSRVADK